jgi:ParB family chromosome partitioning protein
VKANTIAAMLKSGMIKRTDKGMFISHKNIHIDPTFNKRRAGPKLTASIRRLADFLIDRVAEAKGEKKLKDLSEHMPQIEAYPHPDQDGGIVPVEGHRRTLSLYLLESEGYPIPMVPFKPFTGSEVQRKARIATSNTQEPLEPLELGDLYKDMRDSDGLTPDQIAAEVSMTRQHVEAMLVIADAPEEVKDMIGDGIIAANVALPILRQHGDAAAEVIRQEHAEAQAQGKSKVTGGTIKKAKAKANAASAAPVLPRPLLVDMATAAARVAREVPSDVDALVLRYRNGEHGLGDTPVPVTIRSLNALLVAAGLINDAQDEQARKASEQLAA